MSELTVSALARLQQGEGEDRHRGDRDRAEAGGEVVEHEVALADDVAPAHVQQDERERGEDHQQRRAALRVDRDAARRRSRRRARGRRRRRAARPSGGRRAACAAARRGGALGPAAASVDRGGPRRVLRSRLPAAVAAESCGPRGPLEWVSLSGPMRSYRPVVPLLERIGLSSIRTARRRRAQAGAHHRPIRAGSDLGVSQTREDDDARRTAGGGSCRRGTGRRDRCRPRPSMRVAATRAATTRSTSASGRRRRRRRTSRPSARTS